MQVHQPTPLPLDETQAIVSNEPVQTLVTVQIAAPSPGQRLVSTRTDQVTYDFYDQERGRLGLSHPAPADQAKHSTAEFTETCQTASTASQAKMQPLEPRLLHDHVMVGQQVYDMQGTRGSRGKTGTLP